jgi:hypothetical protein
MKDVKVVKGQDAVSNHHLVLCKMKLTLRKKKNEQLFNLSRQKDPALRAQFNMELANRFPNL